MSEINAEVLHNGQLAVATVEQSGTIVATGGEIDATALVQTENGKQLCVKTYPLNGGGGGSSDYADLSNKPSINSVTLSGNKTSTDLGLSNTDLSNLSKNAPLSIANIAQDIFGTQNALTIVGSPTLTNGVMSGFSENDYAKIADNFSHSSNFEMLIRATSVSTAATRTCMAFDSGSNGFLDIGASDIRFALKYNGNIESFRIYPTLTNGEQYYVHIRKTGNSLFLGYSTDGNTILMSDTFTLTNFDWSFSEIVFGKNPYNGVTYYSGSIDFTKTYIKVDGKMWFIYNSDEFKPSHLASPGNTVETLSTPSAGSYLTTPADGYYYIMTNDSQMDIALLQPGTSSYDENKVIFRAINTLTPGFGYTIIPASAGQVLSVGTTIFLLRFIYRNGNSNQGA